MITPSADGKGKCNFGRYLKARLEQGQLHCSSPQTAGRRLTRLLAWEPWREAGVLSRPWGMKITKLKPFGGFCAEAAAATSILGTAVAGIPVSTTHSIAGGIMGVGSIQRLSAVRWGVAKTIVWAWVLTILSPGWFPQCASGRSICSSPRRRIRMNLLPTKLQRGQHRA